MENLIGLFDQVQSCFFAAMRSGWAAGTKGVPVSGMPGYEEINQGIGDFRVLDRWGSGKDGRSAGSTIIWHLDRPVWVMDYGGFYQKEALPLLKKALMRAYENNVFLGGRGVRFYRDILPDGPVYMNEVAVGSDFCTFQGAERICGCGGPRELLGAHVYWGMALIG